MYKIAMVQG